MRIVVAADFLKVNQARNGLFIKVEILHVKPRDCGLNGLAEWWELPAQF